MWSHIPKYQQRYITGGTRQNMSGGKDGIPNTVAIKVLAQIQDIIENDEYSDFEIIVEEIVCVFEKYKIDSENCHDF